MSQDMIEKIINAARTKSTVWPDRIDSSDKERFELHTHETLSDSDVIKIKELMAWFETNYNSKLSIIGGGWGCTKFVFEIQASEEEGRRIIEDILSNEEFKNKATEAKFKLFVIPKSNERINIDAIRAKNMKKDKSVNISGVTGSQIQVQSDHSKQMQKNNGPDNLEELLSTWKDILLKDNSVPDEMRDDHITDIDTLHREIKKSNPRPSVIETILTSLGSVASLASLTHQIHPFLPAI